MRQYGTEYVAIETPFCLQRWEPGADDKFKGCGISEIFTNIVDAHIDGYREREVFCEKWCVDTTMPSAVLCCDTTNTSTPLLRVCSTTSKPQHARLSVACPNEHNTRE